MAKDKKEDKKLTGEQAIKKIQSLKNEAHQSRQDEHEEQSPFPAAELVVRG